MPNPYITRKREQADAIKATIEGLQTRAADENRDLTEEELRSIQEQSEQYKTIVSELESLNDVEVRSRKVAEMANAVNGGGEQRTTSNASAVDRDPGHYRSAKEGGQYSFFADIYHSRQGDEAAARRLQEHTRALDTTAGAGVIPPKWMASEFETAVRQGRPLANAVRNVPIGDDPRPIVFPKQTTTTGVDEQSAEHDPVHDQSPGWASSASTSVTPVAVAGKQVVSRQLLDSSNPAVDGLIYEDLIGEMNTNIEQRVANAILAAGPSALTADAAASDTTAATHYNRVALQAQVAVRRNRKRGASLYVVSVSRWGDLLGLTDTTGRPLIPAETAGQMNVPGVGTVNVDGRWHGLGIVATDAFEPQSVTDPLEDSFAAVRATDVLLLEGNTLRFRYEEKSGPESIELGVWKYVAVHVKYATLSVQLVDVEVSPSA